MEANIDVVGTVPGALDHGCGSDQSELAVRVQQ